MCNAWNHEPGCDCGFGPPYPWTITPGPRMSCEERSATDEDAYRHALEEAGVEAAEIDNLIRHYHAEGYPLTMQTWARLSGSKRRGILSQLKELFLDYEVLDHEDKEIAIPLFLLHSPPVHGSRVTYSQIQEGGRRESWSVTVLGYGFGDTQQFTARNEFEFSATEGLCKLAYLPVRLRLTLLNGYLGTRHLGPFLRVEAAPSSEDWIVNEGVRRIKPPECIKGVKFSDVKELFPLCDSGSEGQVSYTRILKTSRSREFGFEVEAFGLKGICGGDIRCENEIRLSLDLPCGYDYIMFHHTRINGVVWKVERGKTGR